VEGNDGLQGRRAGEEKYTSRVEEGEKTTCRCQWFVNIAQPRDTAPRGGGMAERRGSV